MKQLDDEIFYKWLFEKDYIHLNYTYDYSLGTKDNCISYPDELKNFFETSAMKRLSRILQLSRIINFKPDAFHTRYEHSLGVFYRKKLLIQHQLSSSSWKEYIENNNLKVYLIAELIKSAGHDIGHLPLSHVLELSLIGKPGFHELMGKRILTENIEVQKCLKSINADLPLALKQVLAEDIFGFNLLDEGNYDIDRLDYLNRDAVYTHSNFKSPLEPSTVTEIDVDSNGNICFNQDNSISTNSSTFKKKVCVFEHSSLPIIENFLKHRVLAYKNIYLSPQAQMLDSIICLYLKEFNKTGTSQNNPLFSFISTLNSDYTNVDIDEYLKWDDVSFYNSILESIHQTPDKNLQLFGASIFPPMYSFINMTHALVSSNIDYTKPNKGLSAEDLKLIKNLNSIIISNSEISNRIKFSNSKELSLYYETDLEKINLLPNSSAIFVLHKNIVAYNPEEPIFIQDSCGKIYTLDKHPASTTDWSKQIESVNLAYTYTPYLNVLGLSEEKQTSIKSRFTNQTNYTSLSFMPASQITNVNSGLLGLSYLVDSTR